MKCQNINCNSKALEYADLDLKASYLHKYSEEEIKIVVKVKLCPECWSELITQKSWKIGG